MNLKLVAVTGTCVAGIAAAVAIPRTAVTQIIKVNDSVVLPAENADDVPVAVMPAPGGDPTSAIASHNRWLQGLMNQPIPHLDYPGEVSLGEILNYLAEHYTATQTTEGTDDFHMVIWPDMPALGVDGIASLDEIVVSNIDLNGIPLRNALELLFGKIEELTWDIHDGVFEVTTKHALRTEAKYKTSRMYRIPSTTLPDLEDLIRDHLRTQKIYFGRGGEAKSDEDTTNGALTVLADSLIVTHHWRAQEAVKTFLETLGLL